MKRWMSPIGTIEHCVGFVFAGIQNSSGGTIGTLPEKKTRLMATVSMIPANILVLARWRAWSASCPTVGAICRGIADEYAMEGSSQCVFKDVGEGGRLTVRGNISYPGSDPTTVAESYSYYKSL